MCNIYPNEREYKNIKYQYVVYKRGLCAIDRVSQTKNKNSGIRPKTKSITGSFRIKYKINKSISDYAMKYLCIYSLFGLLFSNFERNSSKLISDGFLHQKIDQVQKLLVTVNYCHPVHRVALQENRS